MSIYVRVPDSFREGTDGFYSRAPDSYVTGAPISQRVPDSFEPPSPSTRWQYRFARSTHVRLTTLTVDTNNPGRIEFEIELDGDFSTHNDLIGEEAGLMYIRYRTGQDWRSGNGSYRNIVNPPEQLTPGSFNSVVWAWTRVEATNGAMTIVNDGGGVGNYQNLGGVLTDWKFAQRQNNQGMAGVFRNVAIYDSDTGGNLIHYYPIDDNSTTIRDTIGGVDGELVGTGGAWEEVPL